VVDRLILNCWEAPRWARWAPIAKRWRPVLDLLEARAQFEASLRAAYIRVEEQGAGFHASQSPFTLRHTRLTVSLPTALARRPRTELCKARSRLSRRRSLLPASRSARRFGRRAGISCSPADMTHLSAPATLPPMRLGQSQSPQEKAVIPPTQTAQRQLRFSKRLYHAQLDSLRTLSKVASNLVRKDHTHLYCNGTATAEA
jgi:hypothetical protein